MPEIFGFDAFAPSKIAKRIETMNASLGFALRQLLGGVVFSLGLLLVTVAGAELFTGNNLLVLAWADGKISAFELLRN